jgi:uridine kinase
VAAQVVMLAGASGSGKSSLCRRLGLPVLTLDDFYRDGGDPLLPQRFGIVDWDDTRSWDAAAAVATIERLCLGRRWADVPVYDIPSSRRTGTARLDLAGAELFVAEGIFAAEVVAAIAELGVLADAICLHLHPAVTFGRRLLRDLAESRKPPLTLLRRGLTLARAEPELVRRWTAAGCRPMSVAGAEKCIRSLTDAG